MPHGPRRLAIQATLLRHGSLWGDEGYEHASWAAPQRIDGILTLTRRGGDPCSVPVRLQHRGLRRVVVPALPRGPARARGPVGQHLGEGGAAAQGHADRGLPGGRARRAPLRALGSLHQLPPGCAPRRVLPTSRAQSAHVLPWPGVGAGAVAWARLTALPSLLHSVVPRVRGVGADGRQRHRPGGLVHNAHGREVRIACRRRAARAAA